MKNVYACLLGEWVNLNDDENCVMGKNLASPTNWWKEEPDINAPTSRKPHDFYSYDHVKICYKGVDYQIHPSFIQIVTK